MILGQVIGQVIATIKDESMHGRKLLITQLLNHKREPIGRPQVALEVVHAGIGDFVFLVRARDASFAVVPNAPADLAIVGIIDHWDTIDPASLELPFGETWFT
ncbi:MAG: EutN/CcmL family microcompartment protein [Chloroflexi bacterium]|nr:EutN/CcmL family microcompartment protein [Chloroflexota bacterium]